MRHPRMVLALVAALAACAPRAASPDGGPEQRARRNESILYAEEIAGASVSDAYEAIMSLRPRFLAARGMPNIHGGPGLRIVVDGLTVPEVDGLRSIRAGDIVYVRYLSAMEATTYWGGGFTTPVVYVLTRAGPGAGSARH